MPLKTCNVENMRTFVAALRSGEFQQGRNKLEKSVDGVVLHCCLGVACRVALADGVELEVILGADTYTQDSVTSFHGNSSFMPQRVSKWLGLVVRDYSNCGWQENPGLFADDGLEYTASILNDEKGFTFDQIADCFERTYLTETEIVTPLITDVA